MKKMTNTRKMIPIDEKIAKAKETFERAKARYDTAAKELEDLQAKQRAIKRNELIQAVEKSGKSYAEIMAFLESR
jgi:predicted  nucleic acid-binding Zn-ribbon protein